MKKIATLFLSFLVFFSGLFLSCGPGKFDKSLYGNCSDEVKNQGEEDVDCGGHCVPCANCSDGEKNGSETGVDCGGSDCPSCAPPCTVAASSVEYTISIPNLSSDYINDDNISGSGSFQSSSSVVYFYTSGSGVVDYIQLEFKDDFIPISFIPLNQTMIFHTVSYNDFTIGEQHQVKARYKGNFGFDDVSGVLDAGQNIYLKKISATQVEVSFCSLKEGKNTFNFNGIMN
jgi:hypothetical protein